ncbi:50S ribosomal protein L23 [Deinococcus peraridilitoris]|nr:50S ribosomal protein L23 [Deinococcus peraridilitoris]
MERGVYSFWVHQDANKTEVKNAIQQAFGVRVVKINMMNIAGKRKRVGKFEGHRVDRKKAMVKLADGQKIDALEGLV